MLKRNSTLTKPFRNPNQVPTKTCPICLRDFTWRKKWERNWDEIRYCSDKCRCQKKSDDTASSHKPA